jgi:hypothetical protein
MRGPRDGPEDAARDAAELQERLEALLRAMRSCQQQEQGQQQQPSDVTLMFLRSRAAELATRLRRLCVGSVAQRPCAGRRLLELLEERKAALDEEDEEEGEEGREGAGCDSVAREDLCCLGPLGFWLAHPQWKCSTAAARFSLKDVDIEAFGYGQAGWRE